MDKWYNFYNLEALFKKFLIAGNISSITLKNYLSDIRYFLGWIIIKLKDKNEKSIDEDFNILKFLNKIDTSLIEEYKNYLIINSLPTNTINRRLSTLRKFFYFCINQGWIKENPAKKIQNLQLKNQNKNLTLKINSIISSFALSLQKENFDKQKIKDYLDVVQEFLTF